MNQDQINELRQVQGISDVQKIETVTFMHADNMAFLRWCKDQMLYKHFHVGIVDPPYGIAIGSRMLGVANKAEHESRGYKTGEWDNEVPTQEYWDLLRYCCRELIVWGGNYFTKEFDWSGRCFVVWDKQNDGLDFAFGELALTTFDKNACCIRKSRNKQTQDGDKRHPTQKPVYLYDYLHLNFAKRGQRVLDTHGGSFSHAVAAHRNGIELTIMDREKSYVESGITAFREEAMTKPRMLF